jgi:DNA processing protein
MNKDKLEDFIYLLSALYLNGDKKYLKNGKKSSWGKISLDFLSSGLSPADFYKTLFSGQLLNFDFKEYVKKAEENIAEWIFNQKLKIVTIFDDLYPKQLLQVPELPPFLFFKGTLKYPDLGMSIIGTRKMSYEGEKLAKSVSEILSEKKITEIGGLAKGIDTVGHITSLRNNNRTIAFLPCGMNKIASIPNTNLIGEIEKSGGAVFSQFFPDMPPQPTRNATGINSYFGRNSIMSGYGICSIVVEASEYSGTRQQVNSAIAHGRPVILSNLVIRDTKWGNDVAKKYSNIYVANNVGQLENLIAEIYDFEIKYYSENVAISR